MRKYKSIKTEKIIKSRPLVKLRDDILNNIDTLSKLDRIKDYDERKKLLKLSDYYDEELQFNQRLINEIKSISNATIDEWSDIKKKYHLN
jgi:parvulin-like peptidyl-prolyl isomerase